jgi:hypothetical protein
VLALRGLYAATGGQVSDRAELEALGLTQAEVADVLASFAQADLDARREAYHRDACAGVFSADEDECFCSDPGQVCPWIDGPCFCGGCAK